MPHTGRSEIHADSEVSIVISPTLSAATQSDKQVLATASFTDVLALPRRISRRVHLQLEHELATIRISFTVIVNQVGRVLFSIDGTDLALASPIRKPLCPSGTR